MNWKMDPRTKYPVLRTEETKLEKRLREYWTRCQKSNMVFQVASGKEPACQCRRLRRCGCDPWVRKIPWSRKWQPIPVFLAWKIPWTEEPGRLQSMGSQRVRHNWVTEQECLQSLIYLDYSPKGEDKHRREN